MHLSRRKAILERFGVKRLGLSIPHPSFPWQEEILKEALLNLRQRQKLGSV